MMQQLSQNLFRFDDTCSVYVVRSGDQAVLVDFGDGAVLDHLASLGIARVSDVLMTHHHRDQGQGLAKAAAAGARIWVPQVEQEMFRDVDRQWQARALDADYNVRDDRFCLLDPVPVADTLNDYSTQQFGSRTFTIVPTPGHTTGSITFMAEIDGAHTAFTGDLIAGPGKVWSLASTQWAYSGVVTGAEGVAASIASLLDLKSRRPGRLLPSHGEPMDEPERAIGLLVARLWALLKQRGHNLRLLEWIDRPYVEVTPHLLMNRTGVSYSYVLLSGSGKALFIDYGYDMMTGFAAGTGRASRRPWLYTLPALKRDYGVDRIEAAVPTHYHDDHVAGLNLLREVEGTAVWAAENFAGILERPTHYDLPCLWFDPIRVDRVLPLGRPICWQEYELWLYALPGHTAHAAAIAFEVDGLRVLATGDEYQGAEGRRPNYVYRNDFAPGDFGRAAELYARLNPDIIISGHWDPLRVKPGLYECLQEEGEALERLHRDLLPPERIAVDGAGGGTRIRPYRVEACEGENVSLEVEVQNPFASGENACVRLILPAGWHASAEEISFHLEPHACGLAHFSITLPSGQPADRARIAADVTLGERRLGQQAEALVTIRRKNG